MFENANEQFRKADMVTPNGKTIIILYIFFISCHYYPTGYSENSRLNVTYQVLEMNMIIKAMTS